MRYTLYVIIIVTIAHAAFGVEPLLEPIVPTGHSERITSARLSADGNFALTTAQDLTTILWDATTGKKLRSFPGTARGVNFSGDGKLAVTGMRGTIVLWESSTGRRIRTLDGFGPVALAQDGKWLATAGTDNKAILWDASNGKAAQTFPEQPFRIFSIDVSGNGKRVATICEYDLPALWDTATGKQLHELKGHKEQVWSVNLSADGSRVLTGASDNTAILWDAATGKRVQTFAGHDGTVAAAEISRDGTRVVTGSYDNTAIVWNVDDGKTVSTLKGHTEVVRAVCMTGDSKTVITGSFDKTAAIWDAESGKKLRTLRGECVEISELYLSGDGKQAVIICDNTRIVWDLIAGKPHESTQTHSFLGSQPPNHKSADGKVVVTVERRVATAWDGVTKRKLRILDGHQSDIWGLVVSADGKSVLTGTKEGAISLLRQFPGENARWATRTAMSPPSCPTRPYRQRQEAVEIFRNRPRCGTGLIPPTPSRTAAGLRPQGIWNPRFSSQVFIPQCRNHGSYADSRSPRLKSPGL